MKRVLIYKRTHTGDPDRQGQFGIHDCMGEVRARDFDAVIGIGGISAEPRSHNIDGRLTWIGIGPHKFPFDGGRGPLVVFDHFLLLEQRGPILKEIAPRLAQHMYATNRRHLMSDALGESLLSEVKGILARAMRAPPSLVRREAGVTVAHKAVARVCMTEKPKPVRCAPTLAAQGAPSSCGSNKKGARKCR